MIMSSVDATAMQPSRPTHLTAWIDRARVVLAIGVLWAVMHFVIDGTLLHRGMRRPVVLLASDAGLFAGIAAAAVLFIATWLARFVAGSGSASRTTTILGVALALWSVSGGTMDDWLQLQHPENGPGTSGPYAMLLADYLILALLTIAIVVLIPDRGPQKTTLDRPQGTTRDRLRGLFAIDAAPAERRDGVIGLIVGTAAAVCVVFILAGPPIGSTYRGQVLFGVAIGCIAATIAIRSVTHVTRRTWFLPIPFFVGVIGLLAAAWRPVLPAPFAEINTFPPWSGLARPLPIEMVGVGLAAIGVALRSTERRETRA